jgi:pimeloyl-ACP methyl ester carboxylesterase
MILASRFIDANGLRLHCLDWGGDGAPVLCLHGISSQAHGWEDVARLLIPAYRVLALDQRGHGDSDKPPAGYSPFDYAADIAGAIAALGASPAHIVGHSLGGLTGLLCAAAFPDAARSLVMIDIGPDAGTEEGLEAIIAYIRSMPNHFASLDEAAEQIFTHVDSFFPGYNRTSARHRATHGLRRTPEGRLVWKYDPDAMIQTLREMHRDWWDVLPRVACPVLVVRGEWSLSFDPDTVERMVQALPDGRAVEIENAGHLIPQEAPRALADAMRRFWGDVHT